MQLRILQTTSIGSMLVVRSRIQTRTRLCHMGETSMLSWKDINAESGYFSVGCLVPLPLAMSIYNRGGLDIAHPCCTKSILSCFILTIIILISAKHTIYRLTPQMCLAFQTYILETHRFCFRVELVRQIS